MWYELHSDIFVNDQTSRFASQTSKERVHIGISSYALNYLLLTCEGKRLSRLKYSNVFAFKKYTMHGLMLLYLCGCVRLRKYTPREILL